MTESNPGGYMEGRDPSSDQSPLHTYVHIDVTPNEEGTASDIGIEVEGIPAENVADLLRAVAKQWESDQAQISDDPASPDFAVRDEDVSHLLNDEPPPYVNPARPHD